MRKTMAAAAIAIGVGLSATPAHGYEYRFEDEPLTMCIPPRVCCPDGTNAFERPWCLEEPKVVPRTVWLIRPRLTFVPELLKSIETL